MWRRLFPFAFIPVIASTVALAQAPYVPPTDPLVSAKLEQWKDLKFGLLMHWGAYSQWGVVESWSICPEDEDWCKRRPEHGATYNEYVRNYEALQHTFNPVKFDPEHWARAAKDAGMKYVVFTTKHHDGFCMFDTKLTDYKVTSPSCPFHDDPRSDIAKQVFDAFRTEGLWTGAYFSKPDWHCPYYWWPYFPPKDRNVNYLPTRYPERWQQFKDFTSGQIEELMSNYGKMDILWLDGGQVRPLSTVDTSVSWQKAILIDQDIDMAKIAAMARKHQPGLLVVDRTVGGEYENYVTPEGHVPDADLGVPWETCMPMGTSWSWVPNEQYKSTDEIIRTLVNVVSRGGSLLLNVAPGPDGQLDSTAYARLKEVGEWLKVNGEAVYGTHVLSSADLWLTFEGDTVPGNRPTVQGIKSKVAGATASIGRRKGIRHSLVSYIFVEGQEADSVELDEHAYDPNSQFTLLGGRGKVLVRRSANGLRLEIRSSESAGMRVVRIESPIKYRRPVHARH